MGIPTLVVAEAGSGRAVEGRRIGAVVRDPGDTEGIAGLLEQVWLARPGRSSPSVPITYEGIAPLVDQVFRACAGLTRQC